MRAGEIEVQDVTLPVQNPYTHGVRRGRIVGVQHVAVHPVSQPNHLIPTSDIDMVVQRAIRPELHAHPRREVEGRIGAHEAPHAKQPVRGHGRRIMRAVAFVAALVLGSPRTARAQIDHSLFDRLLKAHVVGGLVDYDAFARTPEFARYLDQLAKADLRQQSDDEQLAFWINVYNAYTIALINEHHERESIRNINKSLGFLQLKGPWNERLVHAAGRTLTLDEVEHRILRKQFHEPRVHFAIVAAAKGAPPLRSEAYTGAKLVDQLWDQGRIWLTQYPDVNKWERNGLTLSPVFSAYFSDFANNHKEFGLYMAQWYDGEAREKLEAGKYFRRQSQFDWALNVMPRAVTK